MQVVQAGEDSIKVSYSVPGFLQQPGATVKLAGCYSPYSFYDRPWRSPNKANIMVRPVTGACLCYFSLPVTKCVSCGVGVIFLESPTSSDGHHRGE
jgi:hypothetical protein